MCSCNLCGVWVLNLFAVELLPVPVCTFLMLTFFRIFVYVWRSTRWMTCLWKQKNIAGDNLKRAWIIEKFRLFARYFGLRRDFDIERFNILVLQSVKYIIWAFVLGKELSCSCSCLDVVQSMVFIKHVANVSTQVSWGTTPDSPSFIVFVRCKWDTDKLWY